MKSIFKPLLASVLFLALTNGCNNAPDDAAGIIISGGAESVHKGAFALFSAAVTGTSNKNVTWTIVEADKHPGTFIDAGHLFIAQGEEKKALTVRAALASDPTVSVTASVSIPAATARVDMGAQPIYPLEGHADMLPGDYRIITAKDLTDPYNDDIEWKWEIIGAVSAGTRISSEAIGMIPDPEKDTEPNPDEEVVAVLITVEIGENETIGSAFMLKATHPYDPNVFGYATVSVRSPSITKVILETEQETAAPGESLSLTVLVIGTGTIPDEDGAVQLSISGNISTGTQIGEYDPNVGGAELTLAEDEETREITVTAVSAKNPNISEKIIIAVNGGIF